MLVRKKEAARGVSLSRMCALIATDPRWRTDTSGTPPRDAAEIVRTTIHRVSEGVLRIKWHWVLRDSTSAAATSVGKSVVEPRPPRFGLRLQLRVKIPSCEKR